VLALRLESSRALQIWWWALHALLAAAACLVGWPWLAKAAAVAILAGHALGRRPACAPLSLHVAGDGTCHVPQWGPGTFEPSPKTYLTPFAVDLYLGVGPRGRRLLIIIDQVDGEDWRRLAAILRRASVK
jgi:hypothetical protein